MQWKGIGAFWIPMVTAYVAVEPRTSKNGTPEGIMYLVTAKCFHV